MPHLLVRWLTLTAAILVSAYLIEGIRVAGFFSALCAAALLGIFNAVLRPVFLLLTLPVNILSLGLFTFVINAVLLKLVSGLIRGFDVYGFGPALIGSLVISLVSWLLSVALREGRSVPPPPKRPDESGVIDLQDKGNNRWE
ncbi:MAG: phage holin family protein [Desulfobacterales bacterium]|jgi:putative membrane protein|nr:phage holin family protein [Desulfobacterales bacterium]